jgi:hypothetical protein
MLSDDDDDDKDHLQVEKSYVKESKVEIKDFLHNRALLPTFRFDGNYQDVESDVRAFDLRSELGSGYYAIQGRVTGYTEDDPSDEFGYMQIHGLFRLPIDDLVEMDFGAGAVFLNGEDRNSGFSLTLPILIYPKESAGVEFRPCWSWINGNTLSDYDLGIVLSRSHVALRLGYRWVRSEHESLDGPYAGLSLRF